MKPWPAGEYDSLAGYVAPCYCFGICWDEVVYDRSFYLNQGWGGSGNEWITASTWFAGEIYP